MRLLPFLALLVALCGCQRLLGPETPSEGNVYNVGAVVVVQSPDAKAGGENDNEANGDTGAGTVTSDQSGAENKPDIDVPVEIPVGPTAPPIPE